MRFLLSKLPFVLLFFFVSCQQNNEVKETVRNFYFAYQHLDFETAKSYCNPAMIKKIELIASGFEQRDGEPVKKKIQKTKASVKDIQYNADKSVATVTVKFYKQNEKGDTTEITDKVQLEKRNGEWKISNF